MKQNVKKKNRRELNLAKTIFDNKMLSAAKVNRLRQFTTTVADKRKAEYTQA